MTVKARTQRDTSAKIRSKCDRSSIDASTIVYDETEVEVESGTFDVRTADGTWSRKRSCRLRRLCCQRLELNVFNDSRTVGGVRGWDGMGLEDEGIGEWD
jgi:hypothetical protein